MWWLNYHINLSKNIPKIEVKNYIKHKKTAFLKLYQPDKFAGLMKNDNVAVGKKLLTKIESVCVWERERER